MTLRLPAKTAAPTGEREQAWADLLQRMGTPCELRLPDGRALRFGEAEPVFRVILRDERALRAPMTEYALGAAYVEGILDVEGDFTAALDFRDQLPDGLALGQKLAVAAQLFLRSPTRVNRRALNFHYALGDDFYLTYLDRRYRFYSQCVFQSDEDSLEDAAERKLENIWNALGLRPGMRVLDIGGGLGGVTEYCGIRGVHVTSLTMTEDSATHIRQLIRAKSLPAEVYLQDMLDHVPARPYDHAIALGVIEHIPQYRRFSSQVWDALKPGGRLYLDAVATKEKFHLSAFTRRYTWRGPHTPLALPDLLREMLLHGFELVGVRRETHDYELTMRHWAQRFDANREKIVGGWGEDVYRAFRVFLWGGSHAFGTNRLQAYHVVAQRRPDPGPRPGTARRALSSVLALK